MGRPERRLVRKSRSLATLGMTGRGSTAPRKSAMKKRKESQLQFVIWIADSEPDLVPRKVYQVLPDESAASEEQSDEESALKN
jgi:hypothetical protein